MVVRARLDMIEAGQSCVGYWRWLQMVVRARLDMIEAGHSRFFWGR